MYSEKGLKNILFTHRRRFYSEEKAKVVAAVWGTEFIKFLVALAGLHQADMKKWIHCTRMIKKKIFILFFKSSWCKIAT